MLWSIWIQRSELCPLGESGQLNARRIHIMFGCLRFDFIIYSRRPTLRLNLYCTILLFSVFKCYPMGDTCHHFFPLLWIIINTKIRWFWKLKMMGKNKLQSRANAFPRIPYWRCKILQHWTGLSIRLSSKGQERAFITKR